MTKPFGLQGPLGMKPPSFNMDVDINDVHCSFGRVHEELFSRDGEAVRCQISLARCGSTKGAP